MDKLIALAAVAQNIYSRWLFRRLLSGMITIAILTIITSVMVSAMLIGGLYFIYKALLHLGMEPYLATLGITVIVIASVLLFMFIILVLLRRLREMPRRLLKRKALHISHANNVVNAFLDGFFEPQAK